AEDAGSEQAEQKNESDGAGGPNQRPEDRAAFDESRRGRVRRALQCVFCDKFSEDSAGWVLRVVFGKFHRGDQAVAKFGTLLLDKTGNALVGDPAGKRPPQEVPEGGKERQPKE